MNIDPKKTMSLTEARKNFFNIAEDVQHSDTHYVFTENGRPKAVLMSADDFDAWQETMDIMAHNPDILDDIKQAHKELKEGKTIPLEDVLAELGFVVADKKGSYVASRNSQKSKKKSS